MERSIQFMNMQWRELSNFHQGHNSMMHGFYCYNTTHLHNQKNFTSSKPISFPQMRSQSPDLQKVLPTSALVWSCGTQKGSRGPTEKFHLHNYEDVHSQGKFCHSTWCSARAEPTCRQQLLSCLLSPATTHSCSNFSFETLTTKIQVQHRWYKIFL